MSLLQGSALSWSHAPQLQQQSLSRAVQGSKVPIPVNLAPTKGLRVLSRSQDHGGKKVDGPLPTRRVVPRSQAIAGGQGAGAATSTLEKETNVGEVARLLAQSPTLEVPDRFLVKDWESHAHFIPHDQFADLPVIDLSLLKSDPETVVKQVGDAAAKYGFLQVVGHDVPLELIKEHEALAHEFMALPVDVKNRGAMGRYLGYNGGITKDSVGTEEQAWIEAFAMMYGPADMSDAIVRSIWPEGNARFMDVWKKFSSATFELSLTLHELLAQSLGLSKDAFDKLYEPADRMYTVRWSHYPPNPKPHQVVGLSGHLDPNCLTILHQDAVGGLQIKYEGTWIGVRPVEGAFVVNLGDIMQAWSNDRYKSVEHRVVANAKASRFSLACFSSPSYTGLISAPDQLVDDQHFPRKYRPFTPQEYLDDLTSATDIKMVVDRRRLHKVLI